MPTYPCAWFCDVCGEQVTNPEEGFVSWRADQNNQAHGFMIVHKIKCDDDHRQPAGQALRDLLGPEGLTRLVSFLSVGPLQADVDHPTCPSVANIDEFVDLIRRVQIPSYEEARRHFANAGVHHAMSGSNEYFPYLPKTLKQIADGEFDD
jgi:hypothetical protein